MHTCGHHGQWTDGVSIVCVCVPVLHVGAYVLIYACVVPKCLLHQTPNLVIASCIL